MPAAVAGRARRGWRGRSSGGRGRPGRSSSRVDRPDPAVGVDDELHHGAPRPGRLPEDPPPGPLDQHRVERGLDPRELARPPRGGAPRRRGGPGRRRPGPPAGPRPPGRRAGRCDRTLSDRNRSKNSARLLDGRVAEDPGLAVLADARDPLGQVGDQPGELVEEGLLGELDGLLEPGRDPGPLGLVQPRRELHEVVRRLDVGEVPLDAEEADQGLGVVRRR